MALLAVIGGHQGHAQAQAPQERFARGWENGTPVTVTGEVTVIQMDYADGRSAISQMLRDDRTGTLYQLQFERGFPATLRSGARVRVAGRSNGGQIYVAACCDQTSSGGVEILSQPTTAVSGDRRTLVMIADLLDVNVECSTENVRDTLFAPPPPVLDADGTGASINSEYQAASYGRVSWSGQVVRSTLKINSTDACDLAQYSASLDANAAASGIDVDSFPHKLYVFPPLSQCPFVGASNLGGARPRSFSLSCTNRGLYSHELGHSLGMSHAASYYDAYTAGSGNFNNLLGEYSDYSDSMGSSGWQLRGFNAPHREQMGWLDQGATQLVTESGRYHLAPLSIDPASASAPQVIKIPRSEGGFYYLSYRGGQAYDRYSPYYATRVSIHRFGAPTESMSGFSVMYAALANGVAGQDTFTDQVNGITVRMVSGYGVSPGPEAIVDIDVRPSCVRTAPLLAVSPQNQSGDAGGSPTYTIDLTNRDGATCQATTFSLAGVVPQGWSGALSTPTLTLLPGERGQATLTVTSTGTSQAGTYTTRVNTSDPVSPVHTVGVDATYTVLDTLAPSQPLKLTAMAANKSKQIKLSWGASTDNLAVSLYMVSRNDVTVATTTDTSWSDSDWKAGATYTYYVRAVDAAGNTSMPSNAATVTLSGGGKNR